MAIKFTWMEMYEKAVEYFKQYGNLEVPHRFQTQDGYNLGNWISNQRKTCDPNSERGQLLLKIGMRFCSKEIQISWEKMYLLALSYYETYGNLRIPCWFKTDDGLNLGRWIDSQRQSYMWNNLSIEKICLLESIGMVWRIKKNKRDVLILCDYYNIDCVKNKNILAHIPYAEFKVKLFYLRDNRICSVDKNGFLHEIFSMSSMDMKMKYGVCLKDLIEFYNKGMNK